MQTFGFQMMIITDNCFACSEHDKTPLKTVIKAVLLLHLSFWGLNR
jgi:hypothetical protein